MSLETAARLVESASVTFERPLPPLPSRWRSLPRVFVQQARALGNRRAMADSTGVSLTYGQTLLRALALGRVLARTLGPEPHVGLFLPPTVPTAVANLALALWGKVPVNLNYTASQELVDSSIAQCGITHVLASRKVIDRFKITPRGTLILLEDVPRQVRLADKLWAAAVARLVPIVALGAFLPGLRGDGLDATATVIFTSGSTGDPKGVILSHGNVLSNVHQISHHVQLIEDETVLGILPFFHSFGFTVTLWTVLGLGKRVVYHFNPLDAKIVGKLCEEHKATMLAASPTFMRAYVHRCEPRSSRPSDCRSWGRRSSSPSWRATSGRSWGSSRWRDTAAPRPAPVVSVNTPHEMVLPDGRTVAGNRPGTVGLPLPGTAVKTVDPETEADLPRGTEGMVLVKGPQVMVGYLNRPDATAKVLTDGWYTTGDLGYVDPDGFLTITDRLSRFSKIGGEMVPHQGVESAIMEASGGDELSVAVTALPDPKRGERLCVIHTDLSVPPAEVCRRLLEKNLPRLWIPSVEDFVQVESLPVLGTGKLDLRRLREMARERLGG